MKPKLLNKKIIKTFINKNKKDINIEYTDKNNIFFNFLIILFFILCILFLIYRYLEKKNNKKNVS
jgi:hypothetical protein